MLTYEQYEWLEFIKGGECTMAHRDGYPSLFNELQNRKLITYGNKRYHITEQGKLEMQESLRAWESDNKATRALRLSIASIVISVVLGIIGIIFR